MLQAYQEALAKIDEDLTEDKDVVRYAGEICREIRRGKTNAEVVNYTAAQFEVEAAVATRIVEATNSRVCAK